jgi:hypothetical protein
MAGRSGRGARRRPRQVSPLCPAPETSAPSTSTSRPAGSRGPDSGCRAPARAPSYRCPPSRPISPRCYGIPGARLVSGGQRTAAAHFSLRWRAPGGRGHWSARAASAAAAPSPQTGREDRNCVGDVVVAEAQLAAAAEPGGGVRLDAALRTVVHQVAQEGDGDCLSCRPLGSAPARLRRCQKISLRSHRRLRRGEGGLAVVERVILDGCLGQVDDERATFWAGKEREIQALAHRGKSGVRGHPHRLGLRRTEAGAPTSRPCSEPMGETVTPRSGRAGLDDHDHATPGPLASRWT